MKKINISTKLQFIFFNIGGILIKLTHWATHFEKSYKKGLH